MFSYEDCMMYDIQLYRPCGFNQRDLLKDNLGLEHQCSTNNAFVHIQAMFPITSLLGCVVSSSEGKEKVHNPCIVWVIDEVHRTGALA